MSQRSACRPASGHVGDEFVSPIGAQGGCIGEWCGSGAVEHVAQPLGVSECSVCPPNPYGVGPDDDCYCLPVAGDGHFLAGKHTVKELRQRGACFAD